MKRPKKDNWLGLRVTEQEVQKLDAVAEFTNTSRSFVLRRLIENLGNNDKENALAASG